jgi:hypothetical protein
MTSEKAFQLYLAIRLHYTVDSYDVFENGGRFKHQNKVADRKDFKLIDYFVNRIPTEREMIELCVANHLYGNPDFLYEPDDALEHLARWKSNKDSLTHNLQRDLSTIDLYTIQKKCSLEDYLSQQVISDILSNKIEFESLILLDRREPVIHLIQGFDSSKYITLMRKSSKFVNKGTLGIRHISHIDDFLNTIKRKNNGNIAI